MRVVEIVHGPYIYYHVFLKSALPRGEALKLEPNDQMVVNVSLPAGTVRWDRLLALDSSTFEDRIRYWESFILASKIESNVDATAESTIIATRDIPAGGRLLKPATEALLSSKLLKLQESILLDKEQLIPEQYLKHRDPQQKNQYWSKRIEPKFVYYIDPESYMIMGA